MTCRSAIAIALIAALIVVALPARVRADGPPWTDKKMLTILGIGTIVLAVVGIAEGIHYLASRKRPVELEARPSVLRFQHLAARGEALQVVELRNTGGKPLVIVGAQAAAPCFALADVPRWPRTLGGNERVRIGVQFSPAGGACGGVLTVTWTGETTGLRATNVVLENR
jgi:hypothetical protein